MPTKTPQWTQRHKFIRTVTKIAEQKDAAYVTQRVRLALSSPEVKELHGLTLRPWAYIDYMHIDVIDYATRHKKFPKSYDRLILKYIEEDCTAASLAWEIFDWIDQLPESYKELSRS